ncbi:hypothetical protein QP420_01155 [Bifidobacterium sp. UMB1197]|nr:hypothetical protein [Bifidobacterium sp. UMB1197]
MMNKKAIAAFAAGATLLAGFAMATPAFAADAPKKTPAQLLDDAQKAVEANNAAIEKAQKAVDDANGKVEQLKKDVDDAKTKLGADYNTYCDDNGVKAGANVPADKLELVNTYAGAVKKQKENNTALETAKKNLTDAKAKVYDLDQALKKAQEAAGEADALEKSFHTKEYHIANVSRAKVKLDSTKADHADKMKTYSEKFEAWQKADADLKMATANFKAAQKAVSDALASGLNNSNPTAYNDLLDAQNRASAELDAATKAEKKAADELAKAQGEAEKAARNYNDALKAYKAAYNAAIRDGVKLPADLPEITDPLVPTTLPGVPGQPGKPGQPGQPGQPGKPGKPEVEKKKNDGKKLPGTGVGVTLTALAATMLAGMGAAVRKARH